MKATIFLCVLAFTFFASEARTIAPNFFQISNSKFVRSEAERFIKGLNLSPGHDANIVEHHESSSDDAPRLVETSFRFPLSPDLAAADANSSGSVEDFGHHAGYYRLPHTKGASIFYFFFESRNKNPNAPVVVWLSGGPGCSSSLALFYENGPYKVADDLSLVRNEFSWDNETNLIFVDQPIGTGFSYSNSSADIRATSDEAALDFYDFLQAFFQKHPQLAKNEFYITGESYAGHYIPAFSSLIHKKNKDKTSGITINLKGLAIGNGLTDPSIQYRAYPDYAVANKLISRSDADDLGKYVQECEQQIEACNNSNRSSDCVEGNSICNAIFNSILQFNPGLNYYDIRKKCTGSLCYDLSNGEKFLNEASVKRALGVADDIEFVSCSTRVYDAMAGDWIKNYALDVPDLVEDGIKVLIYAGEYDLICNWLGNSRWVENLKWSGRRGYGSAPEVPFKVDGVEAGLQKTYGPLSFLKVYKAGHMVPMDQPKASLAMLNRWIRTKPAPTSF